MLDPALAKRIRLVAFDVDGVLTDAGVYLGVAGEEPVELKRFDIQDNVGFRLLTDAGLIVAIVSGRRSDATTIRARDLGIETVFQDDAAKKVPALQTVLDRHGVAWEETAFVGDDLPDIPVLTRVGLPVAVANAVPEVKDVSAFVTSRRGGHGAAREWIEAFLRARGEWEEAVRRYLAVRDANLEVGHVR